MRETPGIEGTPDNPALAAFSMVTGIALLAFMDACAKWLVIGDIDPIQMLAIRSIIIVAVMLAVFRLRGKAQELKPTRPIAQSVRGLTGIIAPLTFFWALKYLPLTDAVVVFFTSSFTVTILSALLLGEKVGIHRWSAVTVGYLGVILAVRPDGEGQLLGYLLVLVSSISYAGLFISGRWLSATESVSSLVLSYNAGVGLISALALPFIWTSLDFTQWAVVLLLTVLAVSGHYAVTFAFSRGEASFVAPFEYTAIIWTVLLDFLIWKQIPGPLTITGAIIIVGSGLYVMHRESLRNTT